MPLKLNPGVQVDYVLESDRDIKENQPSFKLKIITVEMFNQYQALLKAVQSADESDQMRASANALMFGLESWKNMGGHELSVDAIMNTFTLMELNELSAALAKLNQLTVKEKKV